MSNINISFEDFKKDSTLVKIIGFNGELDETNIDHEAVKIYQVIDEMEVPNLMLDFTNLDYMNSKSIGYVTDWFSKAKAKNGKIVISNPKPNILDILTVVGLANIMPIHQDRAAAEQEFLVEETDVSAN